MDSRVKSIQATNGATSGRERAPTVREKSARVRQLLTVAGRPPARPPPLSTCAAGAASLVGLQEGHVPAAAFAAAKATAAKASSSNVPAVRPSVRRRKEAPSQLLERRGPSLDTFSRAGLTARHI